MRFIQLKETELGSIDQNGNKESFDYKKLIKNIVSVPTDPRAGVKIDEINKGLKILNKLDELKDGVIELQLEDAEWVHLKQKVKNFSWWAVHKDIKMFNDDINGAKPKSSIPVRKKEEK